MKILSTSIIIDWQGYLPQRDYVWIKSSVDYMHYDFTGSTLVCHAMFICISIQIMDDKFSIIAVEVAW